MAAVDLSTVSEFPHVKAIASVGTTQQEINLPSGKLRVTVGGDAETGVAWSSVSDGAAMPADFATVPANQLLEFDLSYAGATKANKLAVAAASGTANITVILERI